jgi:hypothetical protein
MTNQQMALSREKLPALTPALALGPALVMMMVMIMQQMEPQAKLQTLDVVAGTTAAHVATPLTGVESLPIARLIVVGSTVALRKKAQARVTLLLLQLPAMQAWIYILMKAWPPSSRQMSL